MTARDPGPVSNEKTSSLVWDINVRMVHWLLVILLGAAWFSAEQGQMGAHVVIGTAVFALLLFRLAWGLVGSWPARFSSFVKGPIVVATYARELVTSLGGGKSEAVYGHNPLGGWSVVALLTVLGVQTLSGLFAVDVDGLESGPLARFVSFDAGRSAADVHEVSFAALQVLVAVHVGAVLFYAIAKRMNLVGAMITGRTRAAPPDGVRALDPRRHILTTVVLAVFIGTLIFFVWS